MSLQTWQETLITAQGDGTGLASFTTAATLLPPAAKFTFPANYFNTPGKAIRIRAAGRISNVVTSQPTFTLSVNYGSTSIFSGGAMTTTATAHTNVPWEAEILLTLRIGGSSANFMGQGRFFSQAVLASGTGADAATGHGLLLIPNTAPAVGSNFDATAAGALDLLMACQTSNASNAVTLHQFILEALN